MNLEDYINSVKNPPKEKLDNTKFTALQLDDFTGISYEKKQLIKEVYPYLDSESFLDINDRREGKMSEYAYYQARSLVGINVLMRLKICDVDRREGVLNPISDERFYQEYDKCSRYGAQKYVIVNLLTHRDMDDSKQDRYIQIYYMDDGSVFLDSTAAYTIAKLDLNTLGRGLANICIDLEEKREKGCSRVRK